jgi:hypothetical protein
MKRGIVLFIMLILALGAFDGVCSEAESNHQNRGRVARFFSGVRDRGAALIRRIRGRSSSVKITTTQNDTTISRTSSTSTVSTTVTTKSSEIAPLIKSAQITPQVTALVANPAASLTTGLTAGLTPSNSTFNFESVSATIPSSTSSSTSDQSTSTPSISVNTHESTSTDSARGGRNTQPTTERATEGAPPVIDAGESVWGEREEDDVDLEGVLNAAGKLMKVAHLGQSTVDSFESVCGKVLSVWKDENVQGALATKDSVTTIECFEERMGQEFVGRILGKDGPSKSLLGIIGPQGISEAVRFAVGRAPIPGLQKFADKAGDFVEDTVEGFTNTDLQYGKTRSIMEAAYISKATATAFQKTYAPILETLTPDEQNDLVRYAVDTAMFSIDRMILENPKATITPHMVMRSIGTEFLDLDAKMPRFGMLIRRAKMALFKSSGLEAQEARALLTSTPVHVGDQSFNPVNDPHDDRSLVVKAFWRGVLYQDAPVDLSPRFKDAHRVGDGTYASTLGIPKDLIPAPIATAAPAA